MLALRVTIITSSTPMGKTRWHDNEWGYSCRVVDLIEKIAK